MPLLTQLCEEKASRLKGGIYHLTQIKLAYNSNRIEGSRLSEEQTRYIYETNTLGLEPGETANVDDIVETVNHFTCFDYLLSVAHEPLSEGVLKEFHRILKTGTSDARKDWFRVGEYKAKPNVVGEQKTTPPAKVAIAVQKLLTEYNKKEKVVFEDIVAFHFQFERIHPFQDGNGRVGRLVLFKEALRHGIVPFIIDERHKFDLPGYLLDTCASAQDEYKGMMEYFEVEE
jgi:Fic family protein